MVGWCYVSKVAMGMTITNCWELFNMGLREITKFFLLVSENSWND